MRRVSQIIFRRGMPVHNPFLRAAPFQKIIDDLWIYEEIMTNDDNLESNLLTSILLKMLVQVLLQVESEVCYCVDPDPK